MSATLIHRGGVLVIGALAAALSGIVLWPAEAQDLGGSKENMIFLGPFTLADVGDFGKRFEKEDGPAEATTQKALSQCKFYIVDKRVRRDGKWVFSGEEGYPKVLVEGPVSFKLEDRNGRDCAIHVKEFRASRDFPKDIPPGSCRGSVGVEIIVNRDFGEGLFSRATISGFRQLRYDTDGRTKGLIITAE